MMFIAQNFSQTGAEFILGTGRFVGLRTLEVALGDGTSRRLRGTNVIVSTGTRPALGQVSGIAEARPLTHLEALELDQVPEHLIVVGGGYVGLELSQAMRRFGSKVTVVDRNDRLLHSEDDDVTEALASLFKDEGIDTVLGARILRVSGTSGESVSLVVERAGKETTLTGTHLLVAAGRKPNTENIGLELAGVEVNERGYIKANERLETTAQGVWAIGEVAGSSALHARERRRLSRGPRQSHRWQPRHNGEDDTLHPVHRSGTGAHRTERETSASARSRIPAVQNPHGKRAPRSHSRGDARISEGAGRRQHRPHSRFYGLCG